MTDHTEPATATADSPEQTPARMVAAALAHLATHMETGCPRSAYLASMVLTRIATDPEADAHLRHHAHQLVDILEAERSERPTMRPIDSSLHPTPALELAYRRA